MRLNLDSGLVEEARFVASPNFDERPGAAAVDAVVIHCISLPPNRFGGEHIEALFCNRLDVSVHEYFREIEHLKVSAHFLVARDGRLTQFVPVDKRAWHAGDSKLHGRCNVNDFSIGIELEGTDDRAFEEPQYGTLIELTRVLTAAYPGVGPGSQVGHCDVAPSRKTDPGPFFDWHRYRSAVLQPW